MHESWPGTGRFTPVKMHGLTQAEQRGSVDAARFVDRLFECDLPAGEFSGAPSTLDYLGLAARGGFPEAVMLPVDL